MIMHLKSILEKFANHTPLTINGKPLKNFEAVQVGNTIDLREKKTKSSAKQKSA